MVDVVLSFFSLGSRGGFFPSFLWNHPSGRGGRSFRTTLPGTGHRRVLLASLSLIHSFFKKDFWMFNKFVNHTLYTEYLLFNKMGCKFAVTNVYFKKENDIILSGTLWKEAERKFLPCTSPANHQKHSAPCGWAGASGAAVRRSSAARLRLPRGPQRIIYCRKCIHLLYNEK